MPLVSHAAVWAVSGATVAAILVRPRGIPEWCWAILGAAILVGIGIVPPGVALHAVASGLDVYLFLAGMLALAELARVQGVFDWLAAYAVEAAHGSTVRLFLWVYLVGVGVTALLSNDGTILLLTPAVSAAIRRSQGPPLPFLFACAFVANAASFILPISNPANLVVFPQLPQLLPWLHAFALPSAAAVVCTFGALFIMHHRALQSTYKRPSPVPRLTRAGKITAGIIVTSVALIVAGAGAGWPVGRVAFALGVLSVSAVALFDRRAAATAIAEGPWSIIPLVAGMFVVVAALDASGVLEFARDFLRYASRLPLVPGNIITGVALTVADNLFNNLPVGLVIRSSLQTVHIGAPTAHAALIGVDLGPNIAVTGSLATLLWLIMLRRDGIEVSPGHFFKAGMLVTIPALLAALMTVR